MWASLKLCVLNFYVKISSPFFYLTQSLVDFTFEMCNVLKNVIQVKEVKIGRHNFKTIFNFHKTSNTKYHWWEEVFSHKLKNDK